MPRTVGGAGWAGAGVGGLAVGLGVAGVLPVGFGVGVGVAVAATCSRVAAAALEPGSPPNSRAETPTAATNAVATDRRADRRRTSEGIDGARMVTSLIGAGDAEGLRASTHGG